ncbi:hypothetical protein TorRG33x02_341100 [Trema orientale]|uniref:Uncharacterized protein n=1 Tax=Trema orientale TaxID=63057 RepID=A0A2P5AUM6_TREOI|nr:hypothetical protein TorRG33x02_341100 [Trema orientale]
MGSERSPDSCRRRQHGLLEEPTFVHEEENNRISMVESRGRDRNGTALSPSRLLREPHFL